MLKKTLFKLSRSIIKLLLPCLSVIFIKLKINRRIINYLNDKSFLEKTLKEGTEKARTIAELNLREIRNVVGLF